MVFGKSEKLKLTGFSDSVWAGNIDNRKSTSGFYSVGLAGYKSVYLLQQLRLSLSRSSGN